MFALRGGKAKVGGPVPAAGSSAFGMVLPRVLRRPARWFARFAGGEVEVPRFASGLLAASFLALSAAYGAIQGGHVPAIAKAVTARTGFAIDAVRVTGNTETSEIDILGQLGLDGWTSLVGFDAEEARLRIGDLPWVAEAEVRKVYPSTVEVRIKERVPFAIWQNGRELSLVEANGRVIAPLTNMRHANLPLVIGLGAASGAQAFVAKVDEHPELAGRVKAYIRIAERRWDLRLENGVTIKLPAEDADGALATVVSLDEEKGLLSRDIAAVDLRLPNRLVIRLTPEAAMTRDATLKERTNGAYKPEKRV